MQRPIEILICDDHQLFREGVRSVLEGEPSVTILGEAENGCDCLSRVKECAPDVVLLDIHMPEMDGIACLQQLQKEYPDVRVIALTQFDEQRFVRQMLKHGAMGYVLKTTSKQELLRALNRVMKGQRYLCEAAEQQSHRAAPERPPDPLFPNLSKRELQVLSLICKGHSTKQIADQLDRSPNTIENHRARLFRKTGIQSAPELVRWAVENFLV
ncbi:MAG: response regulator transcription factor [Bacteroidota bacterium]